MHSKEVHTKYANTVDIGYMVSGGTSEKYKQ